MKRREFISGLGGVAALPFSAKAQQTAMPVVGYVRSTSFANVADRVGPFRQGLKETGFVEGQNVAIEYHAAEGQTDRLRALVAELVRRQVAVIVTNGIAALAAKAETATIPIVFASGGDPVAMGLVSSLNRPGGNVTGTVFLTGGLGAKRLALLRQLVPSATTIAVLVNPNSNETEAERNDVQAAAKALQLQLIVLDASTVRDIENAFPRFVQRGAGALLVGTGTFMFSNRELIVALAARHAIPAMYSQREAAAGGGLASYGGSITDAYRQLGIYTGRILKGEKPAELPVMQSTKFEFVINLKTAKTLGLEVPLPLQAAADDVIE